MPRQPRFSLAELPQHIIQRGVEGMAVFHTDDDYSFYLDKLSVLCKQHRCDLHAYVLLRDHVHLLMTPLIDNGVSKVMQTLGRVYAHYFNRKYNTRGSLWAGRYRATVIEPDPHVLHCYQLIDTHPMRKSLVSDPASYRWSSARLNAGKAEAHALKPHEHFNNLGETAEQRHETYRAMLERALHSDVIDDIVSATNKSWALGSERFRNFVESAANRQAAPKPRGGDRKSAEFRRRQTQKDAD